MPNPPYRYTDTPAGSLSSRIDLSDLSQQVSVAETRRQKAFDFSRQVQMALVRAWAVVGDDAQEGSKAVENITQTLIRDQPLLTIPADRNPREGNLSYKMEDVVRLQAYDHFLKTGRLLPPVDYCTDEEYLAGACMGLCMELQRYAQGRATVRDVPSIKASLQVVSEAMKFLLQMDFRNGPLRRKYDGVKYSLKALETFLYEMSITASPEERKALTTSTKDEQKDDEECSSPKAKKPKAEKATAVITTSSTVIPLEDLAAIKLRMDHRDSLRETLIKRCRDGQKAAKQSIYALHRGDVRRAFQLLNQCRDIVVKDLLPIVNEEPSLRQGSFSNLLEEYVEGRMFASWLYGKEFSATSVLQSHPSCYLIKIADFDFVITPDEYIGGLCDLTGEIGRFAVARGTARDVEGVKLCWQTNHDIITALNMMERLPHSVGSKKPELRRSVEKLERMLYEMSLSEAAGGRSVATEDPTSKLETGAGADET